MRKKRTQGIPGGYRYPDQKLYASDGAGPYKTPQAVAGYERFKDLRAKAGAVGRTGSGNDTPVAKPGAAPVEQSLRTRRLALEARELEVKELKVAADLQALKARQPQPPKLPDAAEQAGAGPMVDSVRAEVQQRMFQTQPQPQAKQWSDILNSPNLPLILTAVKGALGINSGGGGDNIAGLLKDMGFDLKDLIMQAIAPKANGSLKIAGLDLSGIALTPDLLKGIMVFKAAEEKAKMEIETRGKFADQVGEIWSVVSPMLASKLSGAGGPGSGAIAGDKSQPMEMKPAAEIKPVMISCANPECGEVFDVSKAVPGEIINCPRCQEENEVTSVELPAPQSRVKVKEEKPPAPKVVFCSECEQKIDVSGLSLLEEFSCGACGTTGKLTDSSIPLPAGEPKKESDSSDQGHRSQRGRL